MGGAWRQRAGGGEVWAGPGGGGGAGAGQRAGRWVPGKLTSWARRVLQGH